MYRSVKLCGSLIPEAFAAKSITLAAFLNESIGAEHAASRGGTVNWGIQRANRNLALCAHVEAIITDNAFSICLPQMHDWENRSKRKTCACKRSRRLISDGAFERTIEASDRSLMEALLLFNIVSKSVTEKWRMASTLSR
jgi:hypothetical protein